MLSSLSQQSHPRNDIEAARPPKKTTLPSPPRSQGKLRKSIPNLEHDFNHLHTKHSPHLGENLFWYQNFAGRSSTGFRFREGDAFAGCLRGLRGALKEGGDGGSYLKLCIINTNPLPKSVLSLLAQWLAASIGRLNGVLEFPRFAIGMEVENAWGGLSECACRSLERPEGIGEVERLSTLEMRDRVLGHGVVCGCRSSQVGEQKSRSRVAIALPSQGRDESSSTAKAQLIQCSRIFDRCTASFSFTWHRSAPRYRGGLEAFTWQEWTRPPRGCWGEVFYQDDRASPGARRVLMTVNNGDETASLVGDLKNLLRTRRPDDPDVWPFMLLLQSNPSSEGYNLLPLFALLEIVVRDSARFVGEIGEEVLRLSYLSKANSSIALISHLAHLDTSRESAIASLNHVHAVIRSLQNVVVARQRARENNAAPSIVAEFLKEKIVDVEFLIEQLEEGLRERIRGESVLMKEGRMLVQCQQVSLVSWVLVGWVPVSLVLGIMAMNITNPSSLFTSISETGTGTELPPLLNRQTSLPTQTPSAVHPAISNLTNQTLQQSFNHSPTYIFPFPLFLTLLLILPPLTLFTTYTLPSTLRLLLRSTHTLRNSHFFTPLAFLTYYGFTFWVLPIVLSTNSSPRLFLPSLVHAGENPISVPSFFVSAFVTAIICMSNLSIALRRGLVSKVLLWIVFGGLAVGSYGVDFFSSWERGVDVRLATGLGLSGVVPNLFLLGVWTVPRGCKMISSCGRRRSKNGGKGVRYESGERKGILKNKMLNV
ncbi:hypothetical protein GLAREA_03555 [Glarea lozoyensis ATCC 20868]|uniref:Uncharacterized protein n=1 Tax=Glarea lozoyensis (strain ATCC 20868 / MF5171) TaxID=1116229 RepID=S3DW17_GLAL2|nr:uncharacterized protein GLAREA_03555 [Glarea lozoyensis ATCC 20868]EPE30588.1 hypothetical protein GLAREA_03555 [Glarea lozoyensis ATCC 20868]